jgi:hypothetical protein
MSKSSFQYPEGVFVYRHRAHVDENGDPVILIADARTKAKINPNTRQPEVDPTTGQQLFVALNPYGSELHRQLSAEPQTWEDITGRAGPEESEEPAKPRKQRASIRKAPASAEEPAPSEEPAEQEPAE